MIDPIANEAAIRHLAEEIRRLELILAQAIGNLALANHKIEELQKEHVNGGGRVSTGGLHEASDLQDPVDDSASRSGGEREAGV